MPQTHKLSPKHPHRDLEPSSPESLDLVFGGGVRLRPIKKIHTELAPSGITYRGLHAWIRALNIPVVHIARTPYINPRYFEIAVHAITRPGAPDFMVPGAKRITKIEKQVHPYTRELDLNYFQENIKVFIAELIQSRRQSGIPRHDRFRESVDSIVERIHSFYDVLDAPLAYAKDTKTALSFSRNNTARSQDPSNPDPDEVPLSPPDSDITPFLPPKDNRDEKQSRKKRPQ